MVNEQGYNQAEVARNLGLNPNMLGRWLKEPESDDGQTVRGNSKLTPEQLELRQ
ncbi:transposase [Colwellia sp. MB3u-70]|nr:transposase [Colwellia sp. MB3u-8]MBA6305786.1 transposase [Colwellia sp. MB3u-70]